MKQVHMSVGIAAITLWSLVALYGSWEWRRGRTSAWFWRLLRLAQLVIVIQVALGGVLVAMGRKPPGLHVLYGVLPLLVSLIAESLRAVAAQMVLDHRGLESARAVGKLPQAEQQAIVTEIIRREAAVLAIGAVVAVILLLRAAATAA